MKRGRTAGASDPSPTTPTGALGSVEGEEEEQEEEVRFFWQLKVQALGSHPFRVRVAVVELGLLETCAVVCVCVWCVCVCVCVCGG
jgi:hypothetical protein